MALYLKALSAGDCEAARTMEAGGIAARDDGLCGRIAVSDVGWDRSPAQPNDRERVFSTQLTATGWDGGLPDGKHTVFFTVQQQDDGSWKVTGGSGP
ncbi:hypothetical protein N865_10635 [Intrasporangium oryzae NRRL B-24470]|uniref:Uncharacterized protein n=1 Tax=Intrasporangium oryzae NRRL B-24470 TaxID=1386089 RepID=W9G5M1_9MICO|nr:hypothetical protein [Intrasporangium oryzae]EWT01461.1 hypothetical protein N865_10635 [Intrasporangium oryzae NRRL B-24470]